MDKEEELERKVGGQPGNTNSSKNNRIWANTIRKLARLQETADHIDSYIDACAYLALACELITEKDEKYV